MKTLKNKEIAENSAIQVSAKEEEKSSVGAAAKNELKNETRRTQAGKRYCKWSERKMIQALDAVRNRGMGLNKAAKSYSIPKATLKRHLEGKNRYASEGKKVMGSQKSLPHDIEEEIKARVIQTANSPTGMTGKELRKLAYDIAEAKGITHKFSKTKQIAGRHWYYSFRRRYPELNLQGPNTTSYILADTLRQEDTLLTDGGISTELQNSESDHCHFVKVNNESASECESEESEEVEYNEDGIPVERQTDSDSKFNEEERKSLAISENRYYPNVEGHNESDSESEVNDASKYVDAVLGV